MTEEKKKLLRPWEEVIQSEFSHLVGKVLTKIELSFPQKKKRLLDSFKQLIEDDIYEARKLIWLKLAEVLADDGE